MKRRSCFTSRGRWLASLYIAVLASGWGCSNSETSGSDDTTTGDTSDSTMSTSGSTGASGAAASGAGADTGSFAGGPVTSGGGSSLGGAIAIGSGGQSTDTTDDDSGMTSEGGTSAGGAAAATTGGTGGSDATASGGASTASATDPGYVHLSETGLYASGASGASGDLAEGVIEYTPRFALWTDGAEKRRFIQLPEGTTIDTTDMDNWEFPIGTKLWKEFALDGKVLETRLIEKLNDEDEFLGWYMRAFIWEEDGSDAEVAPDGAVDVLGTNHDVPAKQACRDCHFGRPDRVLGFGAIQLAHGDTLTTLSDVIDAGMLSAPPETTEFPLPGNEIDQAALGYLHANCGHCHIPDGMAWEMTGMELHLVISELGSVEETRAYTTSVNVEVQKEFDGVPSRIVPQDLEASAVYMRMTSREDEVQMPNLGTEVVDDEGTAAIAAWIEQLE